MQKKRKSGKKRNSGKRAEKRGKSGNFPQKAEEVATLCISRKFTQHILHLGEDPFDHTFAVIFIIF
jgi:hypothetical protein